MKLGDVVVGVLVGTNETKVRPAIVIASATYLVERPDVLVGILAWYSAVTDSRALPEGSDTLTLFGVHSVTGGRPPIQSSGSSR